MNSKYLERIAIETALKQENLYDADAKMYFDAPRKGPAFAESPFTLHIPKTVQFSPYILTFYRLAQHYNNSFIADQIRVRNTSKELRLTFMPRQFAQALAGLYRPKDIANQISSFVAKEDDDSQAVINRINALTDTFFCGRYLVERGFHSHSRTIVSDESDMDLLAESIPKKYWHSSSRRRVRALKKKEITYVPDDIELRHRFNPDKTTFIILKGFQGRDRFRHDALDMIINGRPLSLTHVEQQCFPRYYSLAPVFRHDSLWKTFGKEAVVNYALWSMPENIIKERFGNYFSVILEGLRILKGQKAE